MWDIYPSIFFTKTSLTGVVSTYLTSTLNVKEIPVMVWDLYFMLLFEVLTFLLDAKMIINDIIHAISI